MELVGSGFYRRATKLLCVSRGFTVPYTGGGGDFSPRLPLSLHVDVQDLHLLGPPLRASVCLSFSRLGTCIGPLGVRRCENPRPGCRRETAGSHYWFGAIGSLGHQQKPGHTYWGFYFAVPRREWLSCPRERLREWCQLTCRSLARVPHWVPQKRCTFEVAGTDGISAPLAVG
jgi:hypothetical protein